MRITLKLYASLRQHLPPDVRVGNSMPLKSKLDMSLPERSAFAEAEAPPTLSLTCSTDGSAATVTLAQIASSQAEQSEMKRWRDMAATGKSESCSRCFFGRFNVHNSYDVEG
jgi:hypothetical protein